MKELDGLSMERLFTFNQFTMVQELTTTGVNQLHRFDASRVEIIRESFYPTGLKIHVGIGDPIEVDFSRVLNFGYEKDYFTLNIVARRRGTKIVRKLRFR